MPVNCGRVPQWGVHRQRQGQALVQPLHCTSQPCQVESNTQHLCQLFQHHVSGISAGAAASNDLQQQFGLSKEQAEGVLNMSLRRLTSLEATRLQEEAEQLRTRYSTVSTGQSVQYSPYRTVTTVTVCTVSSTVGTVALQSPQSVQYSLRGEFSKHHLPCAMCAAACAPMEETSHAAYTRGILTDMFLRCGYSSDSLNCQHIAVGARSNQGSSHAAYTRGILTDMFLRCG